MNLKEMNESYNEYIKTENFYLEEGLKIFKKSKRLYKYAEKINDKIVKSSKSVSNGELQSLKKLSKDFIKLADEFSIIEKDFASGKKDKNFSKEKIKQVEKSNKLLIDKLKKVETKAAMKKIGLGALLTGLMAVLVSTGTLSIFSALSITKNASSKIGNNKQMVR